MNEINPVTLAVLAGMGGSLLTWFGSLILNLYNARHRAGLDKDDAARTDKHKQDDRAFQMYVKLAEDRMAELNVVKGELTEARRIKEELRERNLELQLQIYRLDPTNKCLRPPGEE